MGEAVATMSELKVHCFSDKDLEEQDLRLTGESAG